MIDKKSILKMAKDVFRKDNGYGDRRLMHPQREWAIGLGIFLSIIILGMVVTSNFFVQYRDIDNTQGDPGQEIPKYNEEAITNAVEKYQKRTEQYNLLKGDRTVIESQEDSTISSQTKKESVPDANQSPDLGESAPLGELVDG